MNFLIDNIKKGQQIVQPSKRIAMSKGSYIRNILGTIANSDIISLAGGLPATERFPMHIIQQACEKMSSNPSLFQYGETTGYPPLLNELQQRYSVSDEHAVMITSGSQQGIDLVVRAFVEQGDAVLVEEPCYLGALQVLSLAQANVITVTQEHDGPELNQLATLLASGTIKLFYAVPDFHNPSGRCWSLEKRHAVASLCQRYHVLLLEDAPYRELRFCGDATPTVSSLCPHHAITLLSLSKMTSPALRVAAMVIPKPWFSLLNNLKQTCDLHTSTPMQYLALSILQHTCFKAYLEATIRSYYSRYQALKSELNTLPQEQYHFTDVEGGMFTWLSVPPCNTYLLAQAALEHGVAIVPGEEFYITKNKPSAIRINFSYSSPEDIALAILRLKPVLEKYCR